VSENTVSIATAAAPAPPMAAALAH